MREPIRILNLEDNPTDFLILQKTLSGAGWNPEAVRVDTKAQLTEALMTHSWDFIISDNSIPDLDSLTALEISQELQPQTPFIILSNSLDPTLALKAINKGAKDFINKAQWEQLVSSLKRHTTEEYHEELLLESQKAELFDKLVVSMSQALVILNSKLQVTLWNEPFLDLTTKPFELGTRLQEVLPGLADTSLQTCLVQTLQTQLTNMCPLDLKISGELRRFNCIVDCCSIGLMVQIKPLGNSPSPQPELNGFLNHITQKMNAPAARFQGILNLADLEIDDPKAQQLFQQLATTTEDLELALLKINDLNRVKTGYLNIKKIDLPQVLYDVKKSLKNIGESALNLDISIPPYAEIFTDQSLLRTILVNLLENSIKFSDPQRTSIYVDVHLESHNSLDQKIHVKIQDQGLGIPKELQASILEGHYRNESGRRGIGLYIVKTAVEKLSGELKILSSPEKGTLVDLWLPNLTVYKK